MALEKHQLLQDPVKIVSTLEYLEQQLQRHTSSERYDTTHYEQFVLINRRKKIESGQRTTSFSWLLNDKRGVIGRTLSNVPPQFREPAFMLGQLSKSLQSCFYRQ